MTKWITSSLLLSSLSLSSSSFINHHYCRHKIWNMRLSSKNRWPSARLPYLQCISNGATALNYQNSAMMLPIFRVKWSFQNLGTHIVFSKDRKCKEWSEEGQFLELHPTARSESIWQEVGLLSQLKWQDDKNRVKRVWWTDRWMDRTVHRTAWSQLNTWKFSWQIFFPHWGRMTHICVRKWGHHGLR